MNNIGTGIFRSHLMKNVLILLLFLSLEACYSFKGISIPPTIDTFFVENFENRANNAPATIDQTFSEALRTKIRNESRLSLIDQNPDIVFQGTISSYRVTSEAPQEGNTIAFNKLTINVQVEYINKSDEDENWQRSFSFFQDFESNADFASIQDELIESIFDQITEDIFNAAFTNW
jgi:hypothetical protein